MYKFCQLASVFLLSVLFSCSVDEMPVLPSDLECVAGVTDFDTVYLDPLTISYISYDGNETIVFKNILGDEVKFEPLFGSLSHSYYNDEFEFVCMSGDSNYYEFNREQYALSKKCEELNLQFFLNIYTNYSFTVPIFFDQFSFLLHSPPLDHIIDTSVAIRMITSLKGNEDLPEFHLEYYNNYTYISDTILLQTNFQNVYYSSKQVTELLPSLFFTKELGMIAFHDLSGVLWVYDRVE